MTAKLLLRPVQRRTFLNFPSFSSSQSSSATPTVLTTSTRLPYSTKQLYAIIADIDAYDSFLPFARSSRVLSCRPAAAHPSSKRRIADASHSQKEWLGEGEWELEASLSVGAAGIEEMYVSNVHCKAFESITAQAKDHNLFHHLLNRWTLSPESASRTKVDLRLEYAFKSMLHTIALSQMQDKLMDAMISKFKQRAVELYGPARN